MNLIVEASPSEDTTLFSYMLLPNDKELFSDIHENITTIKKDSPLSFKFEDGYFKCTQGAYHNVHRSIKVSEIEENKFTFNTTNYVKSPNAFDLKECRLYIDHGFFYFTGFIVKNKRKIEFQSVNFDRFFVEKLLKVWKE